MSSPCDPQRSFISYAITGRDGNDMTDRWAEGQMIRDCVQELYRRMESESITAWM